MRLKWHPVLDYFKATKVAVEADWEFIHISFIIAIDPFHQPFTSQLPCHIHTHIVTKTVNSIHDSHSKRNVNGYRIKEKLCFGESHCGLYVPTFWMNSCQNVLGIAYQRANMHIIKKNALHDRCHVGLTPRKSFSRSPVRSNAFGSIVSCHQDGIKYISPSLAQRRDETRLKILLLSAEKAS